MILRDWAERLQAAGAPHAILDLHVKDTAVAFVTGLRTREGRALARLYDGGDIARTAAAAAGIARLSECDDIHVAAGITPGAVVVPVALAYGAGRDAGDLGRAIAGGYESGLRLGLAAGGAKALGRGVWPTLFAAPLMAAVTRAILDGLDAGRLAHAMALALGGGGGRAGRIAGEPSGRWFILAQAVAHGLHAAAAARDGFHGDCDLIAKGWLAAQAGHDSVDPAILESAAGPSLAAVDCKPFPIARQGANAVAAFQQILARGVDPRQIESVEVFVPAINLPLLSRPVADGDRLSRLCNIGLQLALAAFAPDALYDAERGGVTDAHLAFARRVTLKPDADLESHLPARWAARVAVAAGSGRIEITAIQAPFDHDAPDLAPRLRDKWHRLAPAERPSDWDDYGALWPWICRRLADAAKTS